ncbi:PIN domain-containing protein [Haloferula sp. A504]|uniref:PIN domain-containing protein n=1 Tax=Haloferula sp. A504 TaxID=3373601 RepID=UPI0031C0F46E|nr:PIN domain-containing protein [Verrucomicrobiaceae bacterium E54]
MSSLILIDSSVWVEVARKGGDSPLKDEVGELLSAGRAAMSWPVWVELFQGAKGKREEENLKGWRDLSQWLEFEAGCWAETATVARRCLRAGVNVPLGDVLVHACARRYDVGLLERDRHFALIREAMGA